METYKDTNTVNETKNNMERIPNSFTPEEETKIREMLAAFEQGKNISDLPQATTADPNTDMIEIADESGENKKITPKTLVDSTPHNHTKSQITDFPTWAKQADKPNYTASEVGALSLAGGALTGDIIIEKNDDEKVAFGCDKNGAYVYDTCNDKYAVLYTDGVIKQNSNDNYILLGGGGTIALSDIKNISDLPQATTADPNTDMIEIADESGENKKITPKTLVDSTPHNHTKSQITDFPTWAKQADKPNYTASEVGALSLAGGALTGDIIIEKNDDEKVAFGCDKNGAYVYDTCNDKYAVLYTDGVIKQNSNDNYILLGGGGTIALSDIRGTPVDYTARVLVPAGLQVSIDTDYSHVTKTGKMVVLNLRVSAFSGYEAPTDKIHFIINDANIVANGKYMITVTKVYSTNPGFKTVDMYLDHDTVLANGALESYSIYNFNCIYFTNTN